MKIIDVSPYNLSKAGLFCRRSQKDCAGYQKKLRWLEARFTEGMRVKMLSSSRGCQGFIEYIPGEHAWRPVEAAGYMFIHCLWVASQSKGRGYASMLLEECLSDARRLRMKGVAMVTSEGDWLVGKRFLFGEGFESVDQAPPTFELLVNRFNRAPSPSFPKDWDERMQRFGQGMVVVRSDQCPYIDEATQAALEVASQFKLKSRVVDLATCKQIKDQSPTAYGVFSILLNGRLLSYHFLNRKDLVIRVQEALRNQKRMPQKAPKSRRSSR